MGSRSPSSRRAWIEIKSERYYFDAAASRPPRGGRGLKFFQFFVDLLEQGMSPSSRRAWIEIKRLPTQWVIPTVALLAEGVD